MPDPIDALRRALEGHYTIARELGRGGMAAVYLAEDVKHGRHVAVKVLRPELAAALGPDRFLREIEIAARLDHPHILPLYDSGEADGFLYYVMPYVEGESLRDRLAREKQLPLEDALSIAREVADALSYAHSRDVVHRDIKPDNIMLAGGHARVADFGIARAVTEAGGERLTQTGMSVGTPVYMSPEQAAGAQDIDGRSDLYSLGCVLYEMLAGTPPFTGPPGTLIQQHLTQAPPAITTVRPAVPPSVAAALHRVLSKTPADRFSPAAQFADALRAPAAPPLAPPAEPTAAPPAPSGRRLRAATVVLALVALAVVGVAGTRLLGVWGADSLIATGAIGERERIILADFESRTADPAHAATVTELLRVGLSQSQAVSLLDPGNVSRILQMMERDPNQPLTPALAGEAAERDGLAAILTGEVASVGSGYAISASLVTPDGTVLTAQHETAAGEDELLPAVERLSAKLRERFGESLQTIEASPPLEQVTTGSLAALRLFSQGLQASNQGDDARAMQLLEEAIGLDSTFAMAYRKLAIILQNQSERRSRAVEAATRAYEYRDRLTERERYLVTAAYHTVVTGNVDQQISAYRTVLDLHPDDTYSLNNLGVIYGQLDDYERAAELYGRALAIDSTQRIHYSNLASALGNLERHDTAATVIDRFARRFAGNPEVKISRIVSAAYRKDYSTAETLGQELVDEQRGTVFWEVIAYEWLAQLDAMRGRLDNANRRWARAFMLTAERDLGGQYLTRAARRAITIRTVLDDPARARQLLDDAMARYPLDRLAPLDRPYGHLAFAYATAGQPQRARALLGTHAATPEADQSRNMARWLEGARGAVALVEGRAEDALQSFRAFDEGNGCHTCGAAWLARTFDRMGQADSALAYYEELTSRPSSSIWYDAAHVAHGYMRMGQLYEERGDRERALEAYANLLQLWEDADAALEPWLEQARAAAQRLTEEPRPRS